MKNENNNHLIFRNLILCLTLLVCIFIAVIAWFSSVTEANASGLTVTSTPGEGLEISFDDAVYESDGITIQNPNELPLITSNGVYNSDTKGENFFLPKLDRSSGNPLKNNNTWAVKRTAVPNQDYLETDVYFRSKDKLKVFLSADSKAEPSKETDGTLANMSTFGDFSKNYIAGASRVGFYDASDNLQFIWAPNRTYELSQGDVYTFNTDGEAQNSYTCLEKNSTEEKSLARAAEAVTSIDSLSSTPVVDDLSFISNAPIVTLTKKNTTDAYYKGQIRVRIWVEGCDREAKTPLQGGKFKTTLSFIGAKVDESTSG